MRKVLGVVFAASLLLIGADTASIQAQTNAIPQHSSNNNAAGARTTSGIASNTNLNEQSSNSTASPVRAASPSGVTSSSAVGTNSSASISPAPVSETSSASNANTRIVVLTNLYRVGVGDVLDIRLLNSQTRQSTLYTILEGGLLEYPLAGDPFPVAGLTVDEIDARLTDELRRRQVFAEPQVIVSVRDYVSHTMTISGLVDNPGTRILRREAVPLYVVLAEAQPRADAGRAIITRRATGENITVDVSDTAGMNALVHSGDLIMVAPRLPQFFYIGGQISSPGRKDFHIGMTLTQAILASGGTNRYSGRRIRVSRQSADGRLVSTEFNLRDIEQGRTPDPQIQPGDRIEIGRTRW